MSNREPAPGESPDDDPFVKRPQGPPGADGEPRGGSPGERDRSTPSGGAGGDATPPGDRPYGGEHPPPIGGPFGDTGPYGGDPFGGAGTPYGGRDPLAGMPPLAPFGRRLAARIIDTVLVAIPVAVIGLALGGWNVRSSGGAGEWDTLSGDMSTVSQWLSTLAAVVLYLGYDTLMTAADGRTLGKRWLGLRVGMLVDGAVPSTSTSLLRATVLWLPALLCCYVVWWIVIIVTILASRPYRQGWHDKAARTVVVSAAR